MASRETENIPTGRFPGPGVAWIVRQIPRELHPLFGFRGEEIPEEYEEEIEYLYEIAYPDGSPYRIPLLVQYLVHTEVPTVFIIGDRIELDGVLLTVKNHEHSEVTSGGTRYTHHQVTVALPEAVDG